MARKLPLKFRIAGFFFILEAIMIAFVLGVTTHTQLTANRAEFKIKEDALANVVANISRTALLTHDYDPLQSHIEQLVADPHFVDIEVANRNQTIVASSSEILIGRKSMPRKDDDVWHWRTVEINNESGNLGTAAIQFSHLGLLISEREAIERGWHTAAIGMIIIAIISYIAGIFLTRRLATLSHAASCIAAGDLNARANIQGQDEITIVGQAFDQMAASVSRMFEELHAKRDELQHTQNDLERRVAERTAELAVARDNALNANRAKGAFLANMSHELRTPLNAIIGYTEILLEDAETENHNSSGDMKKVLIAAGHLLSLINNVLNLAKIDAGKMDLQLECFDIHDVVNEVAQTVRPMMDKNQNRFDTSCPDSLGNMTSDRTKVSQCLLKLLSNAAKYTDGGTVACRVTRVTENQQNWIEFVIEDTGMGIPQNKMKYLFEEFSQLDSSVRYQSGTGLGLALTQRLSRLMGGKVTAHSHKGQGSTFTLRLPEIAPGAKDTPAEMKDTLINAELRV